MPISSEYLPADLHYIIPLAEKHGSVARVHEFDKRLGRHVAYAEKLSKREIKPMSDLYIEMRSRSDGVRLSEWYHNLPKDCPPETSWPVLGLLFLFEQLGNLNIAPFNDHKVRYTEREYLLDWSKLPVNLRYLAGPAEVYGAIQFEKMIIEFLRDRMKPFEKAELQALKLRYENDCDEIDRWLAPLSLVEHREAALVYFLGNLLAIGADAGWL